MTHISLILGGARSGKSKFAEQLAAPFSPKTYLATSQNTAQSTDESEDLEFQNRIKIHQSRRSNEWQTVESPLDLITTINQTKSNKSVILIDCMTLWLSNLMFAKKDITFETKQLCLALSQAKGHIIMVSNEVGLSIVPENKIARQFRDEQGQLNQTLAKVAQKVVFVAAGLPLTLKDQ